jgi:sugar lactone lactonase YvrE
MATLSGPLTGVSGIGGLAFDSAGQLWVASSGATSGEQFPPGATGNVAPSLVLAGPDTQLTTPAGIAFDSSGRLYVANTASQAVTVYAVGAGGDTPPLRTISGPDTGLSAPQGITVDRGGHVWVSNGGNSTLTEYAATATGDAKPMNAIAGPATSLNVPEGLGQDSAGDLLVANFFAGSVLTFADTGSFGDVTPKAAISGTQSQLNSPQAVDVDTSNRIYVADSQVGLAIFRRASSTPATVLTNSAIRAPGAVAVAPPMSITTGSLSRAARGRRYSGRLMAILGRAPLRWRRIRGHLPDGLKLAPSGRITGMAVRTGRFRVTVSVTDGERRRQSARATVALSVGRAPTVTGLSRTRGSRRGGRSVTITGTGFSRARNGTVIAFGRIRAPRVTCHSSTRCTVRTPPGARGAVRVTVSVAGLVSAATSSARYRYTR